jgi:hypothetical protein
MAKWPVGVALAGIVIGIMFFAMEQPWFTVTIEYKPYAGVDGHTTEGRYYLTQWEAEDKGLDLKTGFISYDDDPIDGGWKGSYDDGGQEAKYEVYQTTYYLVLLTMLMAALSAVTIAIAGLGYVTPVVPKLFCVLMIIFAILAPIYFAIFLPGAYEDDNDAFCERMEEQYAASGANDTFECPDSPQAEGFMASAENTEADENGTERVTSEEAWGPGIGWWLAVIAIFLAMFSFVCAEGKPKPPAPAPRDDYYDDPYDSRSGSPDPYADPYGSRPPPRGPPPRGPPPDYYDDGYGGGPPPRGPPGGYYDDGYGGGPPPRGPPPRGPPPDYYDDGYGGAPPPRRPPPRGPPGGYYDDGYGGGPPPRGPPRRGPPPPDYYDY